jgi:hypothetical protein
MRHPPSVGGWSAVSGFATGFLQPTAWPATPEQAYGLVFRRVINWVSFP